MSYPYFYTEQEAITATKIFLTLLCDVLTKNTCSINSEFSEEALQLKMDEPSSIIQSRFWLFNYMQRMTYDIGQYHDDFIMANVIDSKNRDKILKTNIENMIKKVYGSIERLKRQCSQLHLHPERFFIFLGIICYFEKDVGFQRRERSFEEKDSDPDFFRFTKNVIKFITMFYLQWLIVIGRSERLAVDRRAGSFEVQFCVCFSKDMQAAVQKLNSILKTRVNIPDFNIQFTKLMAALKKKIQLKQSRNRASEEEKSISRKTESVTIKLRRIEIKRKNFLTNLAGLYIGGEDVKRGFYPTGIANPENKIQAHSRKEQFHKIFPEQFFDFSQKALKDDCSDEDDNIFFSIVHAILLNCVNAKTEGGWFSTALQAGEFGNAIIRLLQWNETNLKVAHIVYFGDFIRTTRKLDSEEEKLRAIQELISKEGFTVAVSTIRKLQQKSEQEHSVSMQKLSTVKDNLQAIEKRIKDSKTEIWKMFTTISTAIGDSYGRQRPTHSNLNNWKEIFSCVRYIEEAKNIDDIISAREIWLKETDKFNPRWWRIPPYYWTYDINGIAIRCSKIQAAVHRLAAVKILQLFLDNLGDQRYVRLRDSWFDGVKKPFHFITRKRETYYGTPDATYCASFRRFYDCIYGRVGRIEHLESFLNFYFADICGEIEEEKYSKIVASKPRFYFKP